MVPKERAKEYRHTSQDWHNGVVSKKAMRPCRSSQHSPRHAIGLMVLGIALSSEASLTRPAQALTWNVVAGTQTDNGLAIGGQFSIDDELSGNPVLVSSNISVDGLLFGASDAIVSSTAGIGITGIDWVDSNSNLLAFAFSTPLTLSGGTVGLDPNVSAYTSISSGAPLFISGSVSGAQTTPVPGGLPGFGVLAALGWSRNLKRRIAVQERAKHHLS